jgi:hypothetical protein
MRWHLKENSSQIHHWILEEEEILASLKFNTETQSVRITAGDKRLFFLERTGFLQHKFLLRTEYSVVAGELHPVKNWKSGLAELEGKKFSYTFRDNRLTLSSRKEHSMFEMELEKADEITPFELCALVFGALRVLSGVYQGRMEPALV